MDDGIFDIPERIEDQIIDSTDNLSDRRMTRKMDRNCPHCLKSFHHLSLRKHIVKNEISIQIRLLNN